MSLLKFNPSREQKFMLAGIAFYVFSISGFLLTMSVPANAQVKSFFEATTGWTPAFVVLFTIFGTVSKDASNQGRLVIHKIASRLIRGVWFYVAVLWAIGNYGDFVYNQILQHPADIITGLAVLAVAGVVLAFADGPANVPLNLLLAWGPLTLIRTRASPATKRDERYAAFHESGHALIYAALGRLPKDMEAVLCDVRARGTRIGYVTQIALPHHLPVKTYVEWKMLVMLAGQFAENRIFSETTLGSSGDFCSWTWAAKLYLRNHSQGIFFDEPENEMEQKHNERKLMQLQVEQKALLGRFFDLNDDVFRELAAELLSKRRLARKDLLPFMRQVKLPADFPLPFGPFVEFSSDVLDLSDNPNLADSFPGCAGLKALENKQGYTNSSR